LPALFLALFGFETGACFGFQPDPLGFQSFGFEFVGFRFSRLWEIVKLKRQNRRA
jgi:hypothetical protein